jgi:hypothetical protein
MEGRAGRRPEVLSGHADGLLDQRRLVVVSHRAIDRGTAEWRLSLLLLIFVQLSNSRLNQAGRLTVAVLADASTIQRDSDATPSPIWWVLPPVRAANAYLAPPTSEGLIHMASVVEELDAVVIGAG